MECMESYIARIYRQGEGGDGFVGIVEKTARVKCEHQRFQPKGTE